MLVDPEMATSQSPVQYFGSPMGLRVQAIGLWTNPITSLGERDNKSRGVGGSESAGGEDGGVGRPDN